MHFRKYEDFIKIQEAMKKDPENYPEKPKFYHFACINDNFNVYTATYLYEDYEKSSQNFKDALSKYEKIVSNFDLNAYRSAGSSSGSTTMMIGVGAPLFASVPLGGGAGGSIVSLSKLMSAEKKLKRLEKQEGIKRLDAMDFAKINSEYEDKLKKYVEKNTEKEMEK